METMKDTAVNYRKGTIRKVDEESRTVEFVISDETRDRHGTVLKTDRWQLENYRRNPIVGYMHDVWGGGMFSTPNPDMVIGRAEVYVEGSQLIGRVTFEPEEINPTAEKIYRKVLFGSLRATSVGFIELGEGYYGEGDEGCGMPEETYYFAGQELAEFSIVNIPSNPNAVKRSVKETYDREMARLREIVGDDLTDEDVRKLTLSGIIRLLTGKSEPVTVEEDIKDTPVEDVRTAIEIRMAELELKRRKIRNINL